MDFSKLKEKKDPKQFQDAILKQDYVALYNYHKQWTPWVSDEQILKYLEEYDAQIKQIDKQHLLQQEEEQKKKQQQEQDSIQQVEIQQEVQIQQQVQIQEEDLSIQKSIKQIID